MTHLTPVSQKCTDQLESDSKDSNQNVQNLFAFPVCVSFRWVKRTSHFFPDCRAAILFNSVCWRWTGVPQMIAGGTNRIQSGSSTPLSPLSWSTVSLGQRGREHGVSCWDGESGLEVMGRREERAFACGVAQNELLPSFCSSASQWGKSLEGQITRAQRHKLQQNGEVPK